MLPILESLTNGPAKAARKTGYGRAPSVLVLLPTRELACQVLLSGNLPYGTFICFGFSQQMLLSYLVLSFFTHVLGVC